MAFKKIVAQLLPEWIKKILRPINNLFIDKHESELDFWRSRFVMDNGMFLNTHYEKLMLAMAGENNGDFLKGKIVADFGCGPRGSLAWAKAAHLRIGIDVLADQYMDEFSSSTLKHDMLYVKSTENFIPLPDNLVDVMFTLNAIDHVNNFEQMCSEIIRVLKPGGFFVGSFNLEEPASPCEPQQLNEIKIGDGLLNKLEIQSYRLSLKGPRHDQYAGFFGSNLSYVTGQEGYLWVMARKPL